MVNQVFKLRHEAFKNQCTRRQLMKQPSEPEKMKTTFGDTSNSDEKLVVKEFKKLLVVVDDNNNNDNDDEHSTKDKGMVKKKKRISLTQKIKNRSLSASR